MQPNLGQGGCMAIEDAFQLGRDVAAGLKKVSVEDRSLATLGVLCNASDSSKEGPGKCVECIPMQGYSKGPQEAEVLFV
jgi:hypothetical protein